MNMKTALLRLWTRIITQTDRQTSTVGTEFMEPPKPLRGTLEAIRDLATNALNQMAESEREYSMRWKCKDCQYTKHFTRPVTSEAAGKCPRCKGVAFNPIL
jgi:hypothetical protein